MPRTSEKGHRVAVGVSFLSIPSAVPYDHLHNLVNWNRGFALSDPSIIVCLRQYIGTAQSGPDDDGSFQLLLFGLRKVLVIS